MSAARRSLLDEEEALKFLDAVDHAYWRHEWWNRFPLYPEFLVRLVAIESHGERDGLVRVASRVFRIGVRAIKADLRALDEIHALERMNRIPPRLPGSPTP